MRKIPFPVLIAGGCLLVFVLALNVVQYVGNLNAQERPRPRPEPEKSTQPEQPQAKAPDGPGPTPKDDQLYVWPLPEQGTQSLVILRVIDGDTVEAAYLVPVILRIKGINAPEMPTKEGKAAAEAVDKAIGGRLLPANLHGREKYGRILADFWLGEKDGGWLSAVMIKQGHAKAYNPLKEE